MEISTSIDVTGQTELLFSHRLKGINYSRHKCFFFFENMVEQEIFLWEIEILLRIAIVLGTFT